MAHSGSVFKSVCEDILEPRGVKVGGYKDEIFDSLTDDRREELGCQICFMVAKDPHICTNKHLFCGGCIYAWSMTSEGNTDRCPVCRVRGAYCSAEATCSSMSSMAVNCLKCKWKGQLSDYRSHSHGREDIGIDPKMASLPSIWSTDGEIVFPDLLSADNLEETVESSRRRHQRRYLDTQLELIEGQARLAFLMDVFEEDLQRHRDNLGTLVRLQQRYNAEQFNEVMRLEAELGQITANLLMLIESASNDVNTMTERLRNGNNNVRGPSQGTPTAIQSTISRLSSYTARLHSQGGARSSGPVEEPREPVRRARFFRVREQDPTVNRSIASSLEYSATPSTTAVAASNSLLTRRESTQANTLSTREENSTTVPARSPTLPLRPTASTSSGSTNPFSITYPPQAPSTTRVAESSSTETVSSPSHNPSSHNPPSHNPPSHNPPSHNPNSHNPNSHNPASHNPPHNPTSLPTITEPIAPSTSARVPRPPSRPRADTAYRGNPYTITWPPSSGSNLQSSASNDVASSSISRQELRRNAAERSRRDGNS